MRILVTGGAGYIGSHTAKFLAQLGIEPVVLDNLSAGHRWAVRWGPFVQGELADTNLLREVIRDYQIQIAEVDGPLCPSDFMATGSSAVAQGHGHG